MAAAYGMKGAEMSINKVMVTANLTRDPEKRKTADGIPVLAFGIAVNDRVKKGDSYEDYANFIDCTMFGNRAKGCADILKKGMKVAIEGRLRWSQWEKDGQKRSKIGLIVDNVEFMQQNKDSNSGEGW